MSTNTQTDRGRLASGVCKEICDKNQRDHTDRIFTQEVLRLNQLKADKKTCQSCKWARSDRYTIYCKDPYRTKKIKMVRSYTICANWIEHEYNPDEDS